MHACIPYKATCIWHAYTVKPLLTTMHHWIEANCDITAGIQVPNEQFVTKQPLNKGHSYITAKMLFPNGGRYRGRGSTVYRINMHHGSMQPLYSSHALMHSQNNHLVEDWQSQFYTLGMASCRILDGVWYTSCKRVPLRFLVKTAALNFSFSSISLNVSGITMTKGVCREVYALAITHQECMQL